MHFLALDGMIGMNRVYSVIKFKGERGRDGFGLKLLC